MQQPRDGPTTVFTANPRVETLLKRSSSQDQKRKGDDETFGLLLVTAWPCIDNSPLRNRYLAFLEGIRECFHDDVFSDNKQNADDAVYLYPPSCLHITVANFHPFTHSSVPSLSDSMRNTLQDLWLKLLRRASQDEHWPSCALQLRIKGAQIGESAGILLWEELTGGLEKARNCLQHQLDEMSNKKKDHVRGDGENDDERAAWTLMAQVFDVPSIVHTTFLRFRQVPRTVGHVVQNRFSKQIMPRLLHVFHGSDCESLQVDTMRFVRERSPYMHIPCDENHVLHTCRLQRSD